MTRPRTDELPRLRALLERVDPDIVLAARDVPESLFLWAESQSSRQLLDANTRAARTLLRLRSAPPDRG